MSKVEHLNFECPSCKHMSSIDAVYINTVYVETFDMYENGYQDYSETDVADYGDLDHFKCSYCGTHLPIDMEGDAWENLRLWLQTRMENVNKLLENL